MAKQRLEASIAHKMAGGVNDTGNDTMQRIVAHLDKEENDRSETGGDDYMNEDWLKDKKGRNMDFGGPGGTGSSGGPIQKY